jgi:hypothetical protein
MGPPPLQTRDDAIDYLKGLRNKGVEIYWRNEAGRLVTRPKSEGQKTMEVVTGLLGLDSAKAWASLKRQKGLD